MDSLASPTNASPDIFWAADGSGFLAQRGTEWGVTPLDGGPFLPGLPKLLDRGTLIHKHSLRMYGGGRIAWRHADAWRHARLR